jgi:nicotinamide-nucleotide amidase
MEFTQIDQPLVKRAAAVMDLAKKRDLSLITAESCTGGLLAAVLSDAPGAAEHLQGGFVVYTEEHKQAALAVPPELLQREGAVSEAVARALAEGALTHSNADVSVAITGVAGPAKDDDDNPVGLVHFAAARRGIGTIHREKRFGDIGRGEVRYRSIVEALGLLEAAMEMKHPADAEAGG